MVKVSKSLGPYKKRYLLGKLGFPQSVPEYSAKQVQE